MYTAPLHRQRKRLASHLAEDLIVRYNKRSLPVVQGDTVKVLRGDFKNHVDKVRRVNTKRRNIEVEGVVTTKVDGSKVPRPVHPSNVVITKLNLTDPWRRKRLERGLSEEVKREIEQEAQQQLIEEQQEAERRAKEEAAALAAAEEAEEGETEAPEEEQLVEGVEEMEEVQGEIPEKEPEEDTGEIERKEEAEPEAAEGALEEEEPVQNVAEKVEEPEEGEKASLEEEQSIEKKKPAPGPKDLSKENIEE